MLVEPRSCLNCSWNEKPGPQRRALGRSRVRRIYAGRQQAEPAAELVNAASGDGQDGDGQDGDNQDGDPQDGDNQDGDNRPPRTLLSSGMKAQSIR